MDSGREIKEKDKKFPTYQTPSLEAEFGFTIRKSPNGGGFLLHWISVDENGAEQLNPLDEVSESKSWLTETAETYGIDLDLLKKSKVMAKAEPKKKSDASKPNLTLFEIIPKKISRIAPDSGVINDRAYLGLWLPAKVKDDNGTKIQNIFHLLFNDGELVPADSETLHNKDIFLQTDPVFTEMKFSINTILNLSELPPVDPKQVIFEIIEQVKKYVEFDDSRYYSLVTLWIIGTYFHKCFSSYPYLFINALKRSGKTKLLDVLSLLAYNAIFSPNMSTSALFRLTQSAGATTLLDETEDLNDPDKQADFKSLLLSGYRRGAFVYRSEKGENDSYIPMPFDVYSPKAIANINGLNDVLEDRCITITMKRGKNLAIINKDVNRYDPCWEQIRDKLARLYFQEFAAIEATYAKMENTDFLFEGISVGCVGNVGSVGSRRVFEKKGSYVARTWELWRPLFSVGIYLQILFPPGISPAQPTQPTQPTLNPLDDLLSLSADLITEKEAESATDSGETLLIMGLLKFVTEDKYYKPKDLLDSALAFADALPSWFNVMWLGRTFKRLGFKDKRRQGKGVEYRLTPLQLQDMAERLNIKLPEETKEPTEGEKTSKERVTATYDFIKLKHKELGPFKVELVEDQEALKILLRESKVFEPQSGYIAPIGGL